ncbi:MAG: hypothetical protein J0M11_04460 [Anaerolineae bacterium]|nr:hypothetical protein [Anaerolineae bacterium]
MEKKIKSQKPSRDLDNKKSQEILNLQLTQAMETYRSQLSLLVTIITVLVVANATVVGYALTTQIASIFFIGSLFPIGILVVARIIFGLSLPVIYTAVNIEKNYVNLIDMDWLASTFISVTVAPEYYDKLIQISLMKNRAERIKELRKMPRPSFKGKGRRFIKIALFVVIAGQIIIPFALSAYFGWRLF